VAQQTPSVQWPLGQSTSPVQAVPRLREKEAAMVWLAVTETMT
jgi:hypothetical protein